jgi:hypothetical protein
VRSEAKPTHVIIRHPLTRVREASNRPYHSGSPYSFGRVAEGVRDLAERIQDAPGMSALQRLTGADAVVKQRAWLAANRPELAKQVDDAVQAALAVFDAPAAEPAAADDTFPGDRP